MYLPACSIFVGSYHPGNDGFDSGFFTGGYYGLHVFSEHGDIAVTPAPCIVGTLFNRPEVDISSEGEIGIDMVGEITDALAGDRAAKGLEAQA
jgi:hypothetical protein